jgi:hypothetical protein
MSPLLHVKRNEHFLKIFAGQEIFADVREKFRTFYVTEFLFLYWKQKFIGKSLSDLNKFIIFAKWWKRNFRFNSMQEGK